ncbi:shikimate dehydrogenase [Pelagimonas varians]|uniref:Shikimate dehydrogenase (NADP(+)) n=1 Tax=Pelagimonas varians TaxID=696760 RepID=A0A238KKJ8_9RHOB|nr:shikimate dehydrogenase [Pelagimonas varians]PYG29245.1 shikimate dehydrogenase [Pelagimonas varians]SMX43167.1 Quinate/shikimate dehydrogenase [Pelagimonas varians]
MSIKVGLIGQGIAASRSPAMHMAEAQAQGFALRYDLFDTAMDDRPLADLLDAAQSSGYAGLNITYPFKQAVMPLLDGLSPVAERVGAVNTVLFDGGSRIGHNTDCPGFAQSATEGLVDAPMQSVMLIGAGGAGVAVAYALKDLGVQTLLIFDQNNQMAVDLAARIGAGTRAAKDLSALEQCDGVVNATPVGMASHPGTAMDTGLLRSDQWVADIVYFPLETQLLRDACAKGCQTLSGAGMAVHQAALSFEHFTGCKADPVRMRATFESF